MKTRREFLVAAAGASIALVSSCSSSSGGSGTADTTPIYFTNPGDSRAAELVIDGRRVVFFGAKDADGALLRITHATVDSADGDASKQVAYDFDENGNLARGRLASGETMLFAWLDGGKLVVTYRSADGAQEARYPVDFSGQSSAATTTKSFALRTPPSPGVCAQLLAAAALASREPVGRTSSAASSEGVQLGEVQVVCGTGALVSEVTLTGDFLTASQTGEDVHSPIAFEETGLSGLFEYPLPVGKSPNPGEEFHRTRFDRAVAAICGLSTLSSLLAAGGAGAVCLSLSAVPAIGEIGTIACTAIVLAAAVLCKAKTATSVAGRAVDLFSTEYFISITAQHAKLGSKTIRFQVRQGEVVQRQTITLPGSAGISKLETEPFDPAPLASYTITATADCAGPGYTLTISISGSDGYKNSTSQKLGSTVNSATLVVPGASQGVVDSFTAKLTGPTTDEKSSAITF